ncbi:serine/threonine-protein kinase [Paraliomyxa miuraensis]|uniref:serine/threonine-protein kinase n=1 Tax=Paraliomyxa miuraensis TaxID=376150 RepID=UPI00225405DA|nr:serine/threonine-protein kinase [Paraliomyxa miuraensis]MCX4242208.1 serine/threonine protein kinase [Paraliomyxa miuraensis]
MTEPTQPSAPSEHAGFAAGLPPGEALRLGERLGQGAVASVFRVHGADGTTYAGKMLHRSHEQDEAAAARFAQEAELLEGLSHENLVRVHGRVELEGQRVLLMELCEGPTLAERIAREAPMGHEQVRELGRALSCGLAYAHQAGIVHRDLKPSNVLLAGGTVPKIADFGMARASSLAGVGAHALTVLGTPDYMAPECLDPLAVDARTDLYALGCILFEMLTGRPPFSAATPLGVLAAHRDAPVPPLPPEVPPPMRALVAGLLAKAPGDRPQAAQAVREALEAMRGGALATRDETELVATAGDRCGACGAPLVVALGVCVDCGQEIAHLEGGAHTVLVTGPGEPGDKLDATLRERLRQWLTDNPSLGLTPADNLVKKIPRVPFPVTGRVSERSGRSIVRALERLGMQAALVEGGPLASKAMRTKSRALMGRAALIVLSASGGLWHMGWVAAALVGASAVGAGVMLVSATRRVTRDEGAMARPLPAPVRRAIDRARAGLPAIEQRRHRQGLRAVLRRAVDLCSDVADDDEAAEELARACDAALAATARLDELDRRLATLDRDSASKDARALLHARDTWASRLLSLTATLDTLAMRRAAAGARRGLHEDEERLERLRAQVEALAEVQST